MNSILERAFPEDKIVGEEDATELRQQTNEELRNRVCELANEALSGPLAFGDNSQWGIGPGSERDVESLLKAIDRGNYDGGRYGSKYMSIPSLVF